MRCHIRILARLVSFFILVGADVILRDVGLLSVVVRICERERILLIIIVESVMLLHFVIYLVSILNKVRMGRRYLELPTLLARLWIATGGLI